MYWHSTNSHRIVSHYNSICYVQPNEQLDYPGPPACPSFCPFSFRRSASFLLRLSAWGYRFSVPQVTQRTTRTSAHSFWPPWLALLISCTQLAPRTRSVSQRLQIDRFTSCGSRSCVLRDIPRSCEMYAREIFGRWSRPDDSFWTVAVAVAVAAAAG